MKQQINNGKIVPRQSFAPNFFVPVFALNSASIQRNRSAMRIASLPVPPPPMLKHKLPDYLNPLPQRMTSVDIDYLRAQGALSLPDTPVRNALLRAYLEYVHAYMPLIDHHKLLQVIEEGSGETGRISLLLFQAVIVAGTAFVDMDFLRSAGYTNRKAARKVFFQKARVSSAYLFSVLLANMCRFSVTSTTKSTAFLSCNPSYL